MSLTKSEFVECASKLYDRCTDLEEDRDRATRYEDNATFGCSGVLEEGDTHEEDHLCPTFVNFARMEMSVGGDNWENVKTYKFNDIQDVYKRFKFTYDGFKCNDCFRRDGMKSRKRNTRGDTSPKEISDGQKRARILSRTDKRF